MFEKPAKSGVWCVFTAKNEPCCPDATPTSNLRRLVNISPKKDTPNAPHSTGPVQISFLSPNLTIMHRQTSPAELDSGGTTVYSDGTVDRSLEKYPTGVEWLRVPELGGGPETWAPPGIHRYPLSSTVFSWIPCQPIAAFFLLFLMGGLGMVNATTGQVFEQSFEDDRQPSWKIRQWDVVKDPGEIELGRSNKQHHSGEWSYRFQFKAGLGRQLLVSHEIEPAAIINELSPSLYLYTNRPGAQVFARVVLPATPNPDGDGPMTTLVPGQACEQRNRWVSLGFGSQGSQDNGVNLRARLLTQVQKLRQKYGAHVSETGAYVDAIVLNLYTGPGLHEVFVDSLKVTGFVPRVQGTQLRTADRIVEASELGNEISPATLIQDDETRPSRVQTDGTVVLIDQRPFVVRALEYNGEALTAVREWGFNTIWLKDVPSLDLLRRAREQELWVIGPPPTDDGPRPIDWQYDAVLAWLVGQDVTWMDQGQVRQKIESIRRVDPRVGRPVMVQCRSGFADYARAAEMLCAGRRVMGTPFPLTDYDDWFKQRQTLAQSYLPILAEIDTELPESLETQVIGLSGIQPPLMIQWAQVRGQVWQAVAGGARGFLFRSRRRIDDDTSSEQARRTQLTLVNRQIQQLGPWIAGGVVTEPLPQPDPSLMVSVLKTSRSRLLLVHQSTGRESMAAGVAKQDLLTIRDAAAGVSDQPYRLTPTGLIPATHQRLGSQLAIQLENAGDWEWIVLTQDPLVVRYVDQVSQSAQTWTNNQLQIEATRQEADWSNRLLSAMLQSGREPEQMRQRVSRITELAGSAERQVASADPLAVWNQSQTMYREVGNVHDSILQEAHTMLPYPQGSPLALHSWLVPLQWQAFARWANASWTPNALPGGDFEDLGHLTRHGWQHQSAPGMSIQTLVQLHPDATVEGRRGLLMAARPDGGLAPETVESAPVWVSSAPIEIPANHWIRIQGYCKIDTTIQGSLEGFLIRDSLGGDALASILRRTDGWQPFVIYRATNEPHTLQLQFALTGYGTVYLDEVTVQMASNNPTMGGTNENQRLGDAVSDKPTTIDR